MKILVVGSNKQWAFENHYIKHFKGLGIDADAFPAHDIFYAYYYKNLTNKLLHRIGLSSIYEKINQELLNFIENRNYNIVWVFKGMEIFPSTLRTIKKKGIKLVNLNPDHPFKFDFRGSGNKNVYNSIGEYHLHLCYSLPVKERIENEYGIKGEWLPFGFEEEEITIPAEKEEILKACFIGNPDLFRVKTIKNLALKGVPIDLYGNNWERWIKPSLEMNISIHPAVYKGDFNKVATKYRLQLNIFRPHNDNSHNMRTFEMPGLGCIMLAPESKEHSLLFNDTSEAFFFSGEDELYSKANLILNMDYVTTLAIRKKAIQRSVDSEYSYRNRAAQVIEIFKTL